MDLENKSRILLIGSPGGGKSTFSRILGEYTGLPVIHLDRYFWKPGWVKRETDEWRSVVNEIASGDKWIIDGNYRSTLKLRISKADAVFFFDFPPMLSVYRIFKRIVKAKFGLEKRYDLNSGCPEKWFDAEFVRFTWNFQRDYSPFNYRVLRETNYDMNKCVIFRKPSEVNSFFDSLKK